MKYTVIIFTFLVSNVFAQLSCPVSVDVVQDSSCLGVFYQLNATPGYTSYSWTPSAGLSNPSISNPIATPSVPTTYTLSISTFAAGSGTNLITNPDFSMGNTGFTSDLSYSTSYSPCNYYIAPTWFTWTDPTLIDHTTGSGMYMSIDGCTVSGILWESNISVTPNTDYDFSFWATRADQIQPIFEIHFIGNISGDNVVSTLTDIPYAGVWTWDQYTVPAWNSGSNTNLTIRIVNLETNGYGNDFGLDDFDFHNLDSSCTSTVAVTISEPTPVLPVAQETPNVFTPNNDGLNDKFILLAVQVQNCKIYNRWGSLIKETKNQNEVWDGKSSANELCADGVYYYIVIAENECAEVITKSGFVHLVR